MAVVKLYTGKYPVVELTGINNLGTEDIKSVKMATGVTALLNGAGVVVNEVKGEASLPAAITDDVWLHASVEKLYNGEGRSDFAITSNTGFMGRVYRIRAGQTFETNAVQYDDTTYANVAAIKTALASAPLYLIPSITSLWTLTATAPTTSPKYCQVKAVVILPDGTYGLEVITKLK